MEFEHDEPDPAFRVLEAEALPLVREVGPHLLLGSPFGGDQKVVSQSNGPIFSTNDSQKGKSPSLLGKYR